jgi:magnesium-transporting ATPase (P-type)
MMPNEHKELLDLEIRQGKGMMIYLQKVLHRLFVFFFVSTCMVIFISYIDHQNDLALPLLYLYWSAIALLFVSFFALIVGWIACLNAKKVLAKKEEELSQTKE